MDDLFSTFRRAPFGGMGSDLNDIFKQNYEVDTEPGGVAQDIGFPPWQVAQLMGGLENSFFYDGPPDSSVNLVDTTNKLPGWTTTVSGASTLAWSSGTPDIPGGALVTFTSAGAGTGSITQTRLVPDSVSSSWVMWAEATFTATANSIDQATITAQFLTSDGTTATGAAGSELVTGTSLNALSDNTRTLRAIPNGDGRVPDDAVYLQVTVSLVAVVGIGGAAGVVACSQAVVHSQGGLRGWSVLAAARDVGLRTTSSGNVTLSGQYDALVVDIPVNTPMRCQGWIIQQGSTGSARAAALRLYYDDGSGDALTFVTGSDASLSFTPSAADTRAPAFSTPGTILLPGVYHAVIQNTHASNSFVVRNIAAVDWAGSVSGHRTKSIAAALTSTLSVSGWSNANDIPLVGLRGRAWGESGAW